MNECDTGLIQRSDWNTHIGCQSDSLVSPVSCIYSGVDGRGTSIHPVSQFCPSWGIEWFQVLCLSGQMGSFGGIHLLAHETVSGKFCFLCGSQPRRAVQALPDVCQPCVERPDCPVIALLAVFASVIPLSQLWLLQGLLGGIGTRPLYLPDIAF